MTPLIIENILSHSLTEVNIETGATLVTGKNSAGKTNFAAVVAALTSHNDNPRSLSVTQKKQYVADGSIEGAAALGEGDSAIEWSPTSGMSIPAGVEPEAVEQAVGLMNFIDGGRDKKKRAEKYQSLFLPADPRAVLAPKWTQAQEQLDAVCSEIEHSGWDKAEAIYVAKRREAKARWQAITGVTYGVKAATAWTPEGWRTELSATSEEALNVAHVDAQDLQREALLLVGISENEIAEARRVLAEDIPAAKEIETGFSEEISLINKELSALRDARAKLADECGDLKQAVLRSDAILSAKAPYECPHCQEGIIISGTEAKAWHRPSNKDQAEAHEAKIDANLRQLELQGKIKAIDETGITSSEQLQKLTEHLSRAKTEMAILKEKAKDADKAPSETLTDSARGALEQSVSTARENLAAWRTYHKALLNHENVVEYDAVCEYLGPNGARASLIKKEMGSLRKIMKEIKVHSGWGEIRLSENYELSYDGRPIQLCAENEQRKGQWVMQATCAVVSKSKWVILDAADLLRDESWTGLTKFIDWLSAQNPAMHILVCATSSATPEGWNTITLD